MSTHRDRRHDPAKKPLRRALGRGDTAAADRYERGRARRTARRRPKLEGPMPGMERDTKVHSRPERRSRMISPAATPRTDSLAARRAQGALHRRIVMDLVLPYRVRRRPERPRSSVHWQVCGRKDGPSARALRRPNPLAPTKLFVEHRSS